MIMDNKFERVWKGAARKSETPEIPNSTHHRKKKSKIKKKTVKPVPLIKTSPNDG
jgi:hypothetical protein